MKNIIQNSKKNLIIKIALVIFCILAAFIGFKKYYPITDHHKGVVLIVWEGELTSDIYDLTQTKKFNYPLVNKLFNLDSFSNIKIRNGKNNNFDGWIQLLTGQNLGKFYIGDRPSHPVLPPNVGYPYLLKEFTKSQNIKVSIISNRKSFLSSEAGLLENSRSFTDHLELNLNEDELMTDLTDQLEKYSKNNFFILSSFSNDKKGRNYSSEKRLAIFEKTLKLVVHKLTELNRLEDTLILVTTPFGEKIIEGEPAESFIISSKKIRNEGDRRDIFQTILSHFGRPDKKFPNEISGESLFVKEEYLNNHHSGKVKIGYFHGVRVSMLYRTYINKLFEKYDVDVSLMTKYLNQEIYYPIEPDLHEVKSGRMARIGKVTGSELIEKINSGEFQGAVVGETAFLQAVDQNRPIVAVAKLGFSDFKLPAYAIGIRSDLKINKLSDLKNHVFGSKRSAGGDTVFLKEYFSLNGINPDTDLKIREDIDDDKIEEFVKRKKLDGAFLHLESMRRLEENGSAKILQRFNWVNPEMNQALLVFSKKFIENNPDQVQGIVSAYIEQIKSEENLVVINQNERQKGKGMQIKFEWNGMSLPHFDKHPIVSEDLLSQMQKLLVKYKIINHETQLKNYINNRFVENTQVIESQK